MTGLAVRRSVSFEVLRHVDGDDEVISDDQQQKQSKRRRRRRNKKASLAQSLSLSPSASLDLAAFAQEQFLEDPSILQHAEDPTCSTKVDPVHEIREVENSNLGDHPPPILHSPVLRQRPVSSVDKIVEAEQVFSISNSKKLEPNGDSTTVPVPAPPAFDLNGTENADWKQVITDYAEHPEAVEFSPLNYVADELRTGTWITRAGNENCRERVYNAIFSVPWRCEMLIDIGFFVCVDSFLSLLTVMPVRLSMALWRWIIRRLRPLQAEDIFDLGCLGILIAGVYFLQLADLSFIYHSIRFEPNIKLYMIYNMLEVFDKLFQSFGVDVLDVLFNSSVAYVNSSSKYLDFFQLLVAFFITVVCFTLHSFIILSEAITISAALNHAATNSKSLLVLLMSNNFAEIKSNVFKRFTKDNMHNMANNDTVERFHISTCLFFIFVQNIILVEGPWLASFVHNAALVMLCEAFVDLLKHSYLAKSNQLQPTAYSEFLRSLCEQVLSSKKMDSKKALHFVPIGPACVVIRVLLPLYGAFVASQSCWKNWLWSTILSIGTFTFLVATKFVVGFSLRIFSAWYLKRCHDRERHHHAD